MEITADTVKELREISGAGMMDCKKALQESGGDMEKAVIILREKGLAAAAKKAGRIAAEGLVHAHIVPQGGAGVMLELNCETDFVAKTADFKKLAADIAEAAAGPGNTGEEPGNLSVPKEGGKTVAQVLTEKIAKIGENINLRRLVRYDAGCDEYLESYIHMGGRIGVLMQVKLANPSIKDNTEFKTLVKDLAMQIAAAKPEFVTRTDVPAEVVAREKEIYKKMAMNEGKPEQVAEKITAGRLEKFYKENCLLEQQFIKDPNTTVQKILSGWEKQLGGIAILRFARFEKGEGLEKRKDDFAREVMAELKR
ncbi:MAG: translation elongation factor Ts [Bacillota bacterium]